MPTEKARKYPYFVEPLDGRTRSEFSKDFAKEDELRGLPDATGVPKNVWGASCLVLDALRNNKKGLKLKFKVYCRDDDGKIRPCPEK